MKILKDNKDILQSLVLKILERTIDGKIQRLDKYIEMSDDVITILMDSDQLKSLQLATLLQQNVIHDVVMLLSIVTELNNVIRKNKLEVKYMSEGEEQDEEATCDGSCSCCSVSTKGCSQILSEES